MGTSRRYLATLLLFAFLSVNCGLADPLLERIQNNERLASLTGGNADDDAARRRPDAPADLHPYP